MIFAIGAESSGSLLFLKSWCPKFYGFKTISGALSLLRLDSGPCGFE
jgi:hypothetical protein